MAEELHGIALGQLQQRGSPARDIARAVSHLVLGRTLVSDAADFDGALLLRLFEAMPEPPPNVRVLDVAGLVRRLGPETAARYEASLAAVLIRTGREPMPSASPVHGMRPSEGRMDRDTVRASTQQGKVPHDEGTMRDLSLPSRQARLGELLRLAVDMAGTREGLSLADITADRTGVSRRTAERLLAVLKLTFPAIQSVPGDGRSLRWCLPHGHLSPFLAPTSIELAELDAAAARLRHQGVPLERAAALGSLAARVRAAMDGRTLRRVAPDVEALMEAEGTAARPGPRPLLAAGVLPTVREAILACRELDVTYVRPGAAPSVRRLQPLGVLHGSLPYLVASVIGTPGDPTLFRLDRVHAVAIRTKSFTRDPAFDLAAWAGRSFGVFQDEPDEVVLRFSAEAADDARAWRLHGTQTMENLPDGRLVVRFTACARREMIHHLATWGEHVEVLEPDDLRRKLAAWARGIATHHRRYRGRMTRNRRARTREGTGSGISNIPSRAAVTTQDLRRFLDRSAELRHHGSSNALGWCASLSRLARPTGRRVSLPRLRCSRLARRSILHASGMSLRLLLNPSNSCPRLTVPLNVGPSPA